MAVITVSRQLGSGGSAIAERIARALDYHLYDQELIRKVAEYAGVREASAVRVDEKHFGSIHSTLSSLANVLDGPYFTEECYQVVASERIRQIARMGNAVIVGRAAQCILRNHERAFHVHVVAPFDKRVERIIEREGVSLQAATRLVRESDEHRRAYTAAVGRCEWSNPLLYDLVINSTQLSIDAAADLVIGSIRKSGVVESAEARAGAR